MPSEDVPVWDVAPLRPLRRAADGSSALSRTMRRNLLLPASGRGWLVQRKVWCDQGKGESDLPSVQT